MKKALGTQSWLLAMALSLAVPAFAQTPARRAVVVIPAQFPVTDAKAIVIRYADPSAGDVILLRDSDATPTLLGAAMRLLSRQQESDPAPKMDAVTSISGAALARGNRTKVEAYWAHALTRLRSRATSRIGNIGPGRWLTVEELLADY